MYLFFLCFGQNVGKFYGGKRNLFKFAAEMSRLLINFMLENSFDVQGVELNLELDDKYNFNGRFPLIQ